MKTTLSFLALAVVLFFSAPASQADAISGNVALGIGSDVSPLWDVTGSYTYTINQPGMALQMDWAMVMDPSGKYTGTATVQGSLTQGNVTIQVSVNFDFAGKVAKAGGVVKVPLKMRGKGLFLDTSVNGYVTGSATMILSGTLVIDQNTLTMAGPLAGNCTTRPAGMGTSTTAAVDLGTISVTLPTGMNGSWGLLLEDLVLDAHKRYNGDAQVILSNGRTFDFSLAGSYAPRTGISRLVMQGTGAAKGMNILGQFTYDADAQTLGVARKMTGKILTGQPLTVAPATSNTALTTVPDGGIGSLNSEVNVLVASLGSATLSTASGSIGVGGIITDGSTSTLTLTNGEIIAVGGGIGGNISGNVVTIGNTTSGGNLTINGGNVTVTGNSSSPMIIDGAGQYAPVAIGQNSNGVLSVTGNLTVANGTAVVIYALGIFTIQNNGSVTIPSGAAIYVQDGGQLNVVDGGTLTIEDGGFLVMDNGDDLTVSNGGSVVYANPDNVLITNAGNLTMANGSITNN